MRKILPVILVALGILAVLGGVGCRRSGPGPEAYTDREPLPQFKVHMRATGGWDYQKMKYVEWTIEYSGRGDISYEYLSENELGHMEQKEAELPVWMGYSLWDELEKNDVWDLVSDESMTTEGRSTYLVELRLGDRRNDFTVYAPDYNRDKRYLHVTDAIKDFH
jgi:hypothetical protein